MEKKIFRAEKDGKLIKTAPRAAGISYRTFMKSLRNKDVKVNGKRVAADTFLSAGDEVEIYYAKEEREFFTTLYSDENIVVINKNPGITSEEIFSAVKEKFSSARFVHRLDRNTSGIMLFALNSAAEKELLAGFKAHKFIKYYRATVKGTPNPGEATLSAYLVKNAETAEVKIYSRPVKGSVAIKTGYKLISADGEKSLLSVRLFTGKTHQIRAHLAYIGHPILGDGKYGDAAFNKKHGAKTQMLCSFSITLEFDKNSPLYYLNAKTFSLKG